MTGIATRILPLLVGIVLGVLGATQLAARSDPPAPPPVDVVLHRFDLVEGKEDRFRAWIDFLHANHRAAVASLGREKTYAEAMFTAPDEPGRLYWITVTGRGGAPVEHSPLAIDVQHNAYMAEVLKQGSHARLVTQNVLVPDFLANAVAVHEAQEASRGK